MRNKPVTRRAFLKGRAASGSTIFLGRIIATRTGRAALAAAGGDDVVRVVSPPNGSAVPRFLTTKLEWEYAAGEAPHGIALTITSQRDPQHPIEHITLPGDVTTYGLCTGDVHHGGNPPRGGRAPRGEIQESTQGSALFTLQTHALLWLRSRSLRGTA
jgi:hypothetical protein